MSDALQLDMFLALFRPLLTVDETAYLLADASMDKVRKMLDEGELRGVDIRSVQDGGRRELRIYRYSVEHYHIAPARKLAVVPVDRIFPHARPMFRRDEVAQILNCTARHVANLELPGPKLSSAANAASTDRTPRHSREGLITFLTEREIR